MSSKLTPERFPYLYVPDTEYVARLGETQRPVCLVAHGFHKGRRIEMFFDKPAASPFPDPKNTLFLGYNLPSELKTMLSLGWELPEYCIDLYVEFLNLINGKWHGKDCLKDLGTGLVDAVKYFGGNPMDFWKGSKDEERNYVIQNGTTPPEGVTMEAHQKRILAYCEEDVNATVWLGRQMISELDIEQANGITFGSAWLRRSSGANDFDIVIDDPQIGRFALTPAFPDLELRDEDSDWRQVTLDVRQRILAKHCALPSIRRVAKCLFLLPR